MAIPTQKNPLQPPAQKALPMTSAGQNVQFVPPTNQPGAAPAPTVQPTQVQPLQAPAAPTTPGMDMNQQVLQTAQQRAMQGFQSPVLDATSQRTQQLLQNPQQGYNPYGQIQPTLEQFDLSRANAFEKLRRDTAPLSHTGGRLDNLLDVAMEGAQNRAWMQNDLQQAAGLDSREALYRALDEGRLTSEQERNRFSTDIGALAEIRNAAEGERSQLYDGAQRAIDRGLQIALANQNAGLEMALTELRGKIDMGMQLTAQDFQSSQSALDRGLQESLQANDIEATRGNIETQLEFEKWKASQGWEFTASENAMNRALELTLQTNDQGFQESLMQLKNKLDLNMMLTSQDWEGIQNDLDRQSAIAQIDRNSDAQMQLQGLRNSFEQMKLEQEQQHDQNMQMMIFGQDQWKQGRVEAMTRAGWGVEDAWRTADRHHSEWQSIYDGQIQKELQAGANQQEAQMAAADFARTWQLTSLEHQFQAEIESGRMSMQEAEMAQQAAQFKDELAFKQWATMEGWSQEQQQMSWQSGEAALDRTHDYQMTALQQEFAREGVAWELITSNIENMAPEQAAQFIRDQAAEYGIVVPEPTADVQETINARALADQVGEIATAGGRLPQGITAEDPVYQAMLTDGRIQHGAGAVSINKEGVQSGEHYYAEGLENLVKGDYVVIEGTVYEFLRGDAPKAWGYNPKTYYLRDVVTDATGYVRADKNGASPVIPA